MVSFIKKESFKPKLKSTEGVCLLKETWKLFPQQRIAEGSESLDTTSKPADWERSALPAGMKWCCDVFKI